MQLASHHVSLTADETAWQSCTPGAEKPLAEHRRKADAKVALILRSPVAGTAPREVPFRAATGQRVDAAARAEQRNASCGERDARSTSGTNRLQDDDMPSGAVRVWAIVRRSGQPNVVAGCVLCCRVVGPGGRSAAGRTPADSDCPLERLRLLLLGRELVAVGAGGRCAPRPDVPTALAHAAWVNRSRSGSARSRAVGIRQPLSNAAPKEDAGIA